MSKVPAHLLVTLENDCLIDIAAYETKAQAEAAFTDLVYYRLNQDCDGPEAIDYADYAMRIEGGIWPEFSYCAAFDAVQHLYAPDWQPMVWEVEGV